MAKKKKTKGQVGKAKYMRWCFASGACTASGKGKNRKVKMSKGKFNAAMNDSTANNRNFNAFTRNSKSFKNFTKKYSKAKPDGRRKLLAKASKSKAFVNTINKQKFATSKGADMANRMITDFGFKTNAIVVKNKDKTFSLKTSSIRPKNLNGS